jgi:ketosteroid isomerase-like protein
VAEDRIELARRGFEAYNQGGPPGFMDFVVREDKLHPDFVFHVQDDLPNGGYWRGVDGYEQMSRIWMEAWSEFRLLPHEFREVGHDRILVLLEQRGIARGSGMEIAGEFAYVLVFRDEKIEQIHLYTDRERAERVAAGK